MISSLVPLHISCKIGMKAEKIVGLHSPRHTNTLHVQTSFNKHHSPSKGKDPNDKIPNITLNHRSESPLVETSTDRRDSAHSNGYAPRRTPSLAQCHRQCSSPSYLHLVCWSNCEPQRTHQSGSRVTRLFKPWVRNKAEERTRGCSSTSTNLRKREREEKVPRSRDDHEVILH